MNQYSIYLKSHFFAPDYEETIGARNRKEAIELFYHTLYGEVDRKYINQNMARDYKNGKVK